MKRWIGILTVAVLMICMLPLASASETGVELTDAEAKAGETVYLIVALHEETTCDSMAVTYSYDANVLKPLPDQSKWAKKGVLSDFDTKNRGVWAASKAQNLTGDICTLAFQVLENANFKQTEVTCNLLLKHGANVVGEFESAGSVSWRCDHDFGTWESQGIIGHSQMCKLCGMQQTMGHTWDEGVTSDDPENENMCLFTRTCEICGETNVQSVSSEVKDDISAPTVPEETTLPRETGVTKPPETGYHPTEFKPEYEETIYVEVATEATAATEAATAKDTTTETEATSPKPDSSGNGQTGAPQGGTSKPAGSGNKPQNSGTQQGTASPDSNHGNSSSLKDDTHLQGSSLDRPVNPELTEPTVVPTDVHGDEHFHSHDGEEEVHLQTIPVDAAPECTDPAHDHTHTHETVPESGGINGASVAVCAVAVVAMGIAVYVYLKKKRVIR